VLSNYLDKSLTGRAPTPAYRGWIRSGWGQPWRVAVEADSERECMTKLVNLPGRGLDKLVLRGDQTPHDAPRGIRRK
jgi:hypothetical protein